MYDDVSLYDDASSTSGFIMEAGRRDAMGLSLLVTGTDSRDVFIS